VEPEASLPYLQQPATSPYPEPDQSSPCPPSHFMRTHRNLILHLRVGLPSGLFQASAKFRKICFTETEFVLALFERILCFAVRVRHASALPTPRIWVSLTTVSVLNQSYIVLSLFTYPPYHSQSCHKNHFLRSYDRSAL